MSTNDIGKQISIVLVRPQYPFNIGACARAMHNTGFERLVLIQPACEIDHKVREGAARAQEILARREVFQSLDEFWQKEGDGIRIAFTGRENGRREVYPYSEFLEKRMLPALKQTASDIADFESWTTRPIYFVFGPEDDGLSSSEMDTTNFHCELATYGENRSYNLAQAVLLALFLIQQSVGQPYNSESGTGRQFSPFDRAPAEMPDQLIERWLTTLGFDLENHKRNNAARVVSRLIKRGAPSKDEFRIFSSVIHQCIRKLTHEKK